MKAISRSIVVVLALGALYACTSGQSGSIPNIASPNVGTTSTLQFAVGTATIAGANGASLIGLNVVTTFRQPNGNNATGVNTPTITAPPGFKFDPLLGGTNVVSGITPSQLGVLANQVKAQPAPPTPYPLQSPAGQSLGPFVGAFGYGLAADNLISNVDLVNLYPLAADESSNVACLGVASQYVSNSYYGQYLDIGVLSSGANQIAGDQVRSAELGLPIPSGAGGANCVCPSCARSGTLFDDTNFPVQFFGGPPAWPSPQGYGNFTYFVGYPLGFADFASTPVAGTYTLSLAYPTSSTYSSYGTIAKSAQLPASSVGAPLPVFTQPTLQVNPDGSGVITVNVPAKVTEAVITIASSDCDLAGRDLAAGATATHGGAILYFNHFALVTKTTGPQTLFLSSALGPPSTVTGFPTHTFCTAADLAAYNAVAASVGSPPQQSFSVQSTVVAVGFDYPAYESSYPFNMSASPPITNGNGRTGQADVTTSYPLSVSTTITAPTTGG